MMNWLRFHALEIGVAVAPTVAGVTVSPWWWLLTGAVVVQWVRQETAHRPAPRPEPPSRDAARQPASLSA